MPVITREEIGLLPRRYAIGKRPLSILLGWGELTYTRLLDGNTPSAEHALELRHLFDDPAVYARALETGRHRITELAYTRSLKAVDSLLEDEGGTARATRIFAVADKMCALAEGDLTPGALQRLVYYAQGAYLAKTGLMLFDDLPVAAAAGPEYERLGKVYSFGEIVAASKRVSSVDSADETANSKISESQLDSMLSLSKTERKVIEKAYRNYGGFSGQELSRRSRAEAPWLKARKRAGVAEGQDCAECITAKSLRKFFCK